MPCPCLFKVSISRANTRCIHEISFFFSKCCQGNLPWGLVIHSSFPSIPRQTTEVKGLIAQQVSVSHFVSQTSLVTLAAPDTISPILCLVWSGFSPQAAETPIHTDIREASNGRPSIFNSFMFQKQTLVPVGRSTPAKGSHRAAGQAPVAGVSPHPQPQAAALQQGCPTLGVYTMMKLRIGTSPTLAPSGAEPGQTQPRGVVQHNFPAEAWSILL